MQASRQVGEIVVECVRGDIVAQPDLDVVVNAANAELLIGGGVAGAIHRAAGPQLERACRPLAPIRPGEAVITPAFDLPNRYVVHCLGPVYGIDEPAAELLRRCYQEALIRAEEVGACSIGFPAISTGAFGYPINDAAETALQAIRESLSSLQAVRRIRFVLWDSAALATHKAALHHAFDAP